MQQLQTYTHTHTQRERERLYVVCGVDENASGAAMKGMGTGSSSGRQLLSVVEEATNLWLRNGTHKAVVDLATVDQESRWDTRNLERGLHGQLLRAFSIDTHTHHLDSLLIVLVDGF